jgi:hypothetical protein
MSYPGPDVQPAGQQPEGAWAPPQGAPQAEPEKKSNAKKWVSIAGTVAVVGIGGAYTLTGGFGFGDPKVGDCVHLVGETDFEVTDCGSSDADFTIIGIEDEKLTEPDFQADPTSCAEFAEAESAFWLSAGMITEKGTVYCAAPV